MRDADITWSVTTVEPLRYPVDRFSNGLPTDPSGFTAQFAFMPKAKQDPLEPDWQNGFWEIETGGPTVRYFTCIRVGELTPQLIAGDWWVKWRVDAPPDKPVRDLGTLRLV